MRRGTPLGWNTRASWTANNNVTTEYSSGLDFKGNGTPIMGNANNNTANRGLWWTGPSDKRDSANNVVFTGLQDDLAVLDKTLGYAPRGGNAIDDTIPLSGGFGAYYGSGVMRTPGDLEWYSFTAAGGTEGFTISNVSADPMLTPVAAIRGAGGNVIATSTGDDNGCAVTTNSLIAGHTYYLVVGRPGQASTPNAYNQLGQFNVASTYSYLANVDGAGLLHVYGDPGHDNQISVACDADNINVSFTFNGQHVTQQYSVFNVTGISFELGSGSDSVTLAQPYLFFNHQPRVSFDGGGGGNSLTLVESAGAHTINVTPTGITGIFPGVVTVKNLLKLKISGNTAGNNINIGGDGVTPGDLAAMPYDVAYNPTAGAHDYFNIHNEASTNQWGYVGADAGVTAFTVDARVRYQHEIVYNWPGSAKLSIYAGSGNDGFAEYANGTATPVTFYGGPRRRQGHHRR